MKKIKIINDPVGGFIRIFDDLSSQIIDHSYFQRLRQIRQLGLSDLVFPGAIHNRFQHTLGAFQLMTEALSILKIKGVDISPEEEQAARLAILLHDIGHAPFSHSLEYVIVPGVSHEELTLFFMEELNRQYNGQLNLAIKIFRNQYPRKFFHQLVSGQLDMDRLDYLRRDSFFSGVSEGKIGSERIIRMLNVVKDKLVVEQKGIFSIEHFLIARRTMYWQVYLHKTVSCAEQMLVNVINRARELINKGVEINGSELLVKFLSHPMKAVDFKNPKVLNNFAALNDTDILFSLKCWTSHNDFIISDLSQRLMSRNLFRVELSQKPFGDDIKKSIKSIISASYRVTDEETHYYCYAGTMRNTMYDETTGQINILLNNGQIAQISDPVIGFNNALITIPEQRHFLCFPKEIEV